MPAVTEQLQDEQSLSLDHFRIIKSLLYDASGITLADHKRQMVFNRINKRIKDLDINSFEAYIDFLHDKENSEEMVHLVNALTTNVTHFFREKHHFEHMADQLRTSIKSGHEKIRIWSAACSIGAEPYSAALIVQDIINEVKRTCDIRILATDIDTLALEHGRKGVYAKRTSKGLPDRHLKTYFESESRENERFFKVKPSIRNRVSFNYMNFNDAKWPMSGPFDFIFCRNVLIYFDQQKKDEYVSKMLNLLRPGGFFYLGHSENAVMASKNFKICGPTIYQKQEG